MAGNRQSSVSSSRQSKRVSPERHQSITTKTKFLTNFERRITKVKHEEYLRKRDVTLEEKKTLWIYTLLNFLFFTFQVIVIVILQISMNFDTVFFKQVDTPVSVTTGIFLAEILLVVILEILFVILPLPFMRCCGVR